MVIVIAHRGARSLAPENTLVAARKAHEVGADMWETDVAVTADDYLILMHDDAMMRTTDVADKFPDRVPAPFSTYTLAEIRTLDTGSWFERDDPFDQVAAGAVPADELASYVGEKIPTLREAFELTLDLDWSLNLELKSQPPPQDAFDVVGAILALVDDVGLGPHHLLFSSARFSWLKMLKQRRPEFQVQGIVGLFDQDPMSFADPDFSLPAGTTIPDFDGFIWTGSDLTVYHTDDPRVSGQIAFARDLMAAGAASWGSCWGLQLATQVGGGDVAVNPAGREWGIARGIELNDEARASAMFAGKPAVFDAFIMHLDEVTQLPQGTESLGGNAHTSIQAAIVEDGEGSFWVTQYHPEYNLHKMGRLIVARAEALVREGHFSDEESVSAYAADMMALYANPESEELRQRLGVGDDIIDPTIRETELRNWLKFIDSRTEESAR